MPIKIISKIKKSGILGCLVLLVAFSFWGCGPKEDSRPTYHIDQTTIDYCIYGEGSW